MAGGNPTAHGDMFLWAKGARAGVIKGEALDDVHKEEIEVQSWSWGIQGQGTYAGGFNSAKGKASMLDLKIVKRLDSASTALMSAMRSNEPIVKALLTVRKAGTTALEYCKITIEQARVSSINIDAGRGATGTEVIEHVTFSFNKITVEYTPQGKDGQPRGAMQFTDEFHEQA